MTTKKYRRRRWKIYCPPCNRVMKMITPKGKEPPFTWEDWKCDLGHKAINIKPLTRKGIFK